MTAQPASTRLAKLEITEVSGVDSGAHLLDGWLVCKARDGTIPLITKALAGFDADDLLVEIERANPSQHRGSDGRFLRYPTRLHQNPAAVERSSEGRPAAEDRPAPAAKGLQFFRPARNAYHRIF